MATKKGIMLKMHKVIYKLIDDLKDELSSKLPPSVKENVIGVCVWYFNLINQGSQHRRLLPSVLGVLGYIESINVHMT